MRSLLLVLGAAALAAVLFLLSRSGGPDPEDTGIGRSPTASPVDVADGPAGPQPEENPEPEELAEVDASAGRAAAETDEPVEIPDDLPVAHIVGRVVDSDDVPVAGLDLRLFATGAWREGYETPTFPLGGHEVRGWRTRSGPDGGFTFDVPVPTADWVMLSVEGDPYFGVVDRDFGHAGGRKKPPIVEGVNDVGDMVVPRTGAITGAVTDASGAPIENAYVKYDGSYPGGRVVGTRTDALGRYELGHLPPGPSKIEARHDEYLLQSANGPVVEARRTLTGPDFSLQSAPSIRGIVVDQDGAPVPGIRIWGWPVGSGRGAGGRTADDGTFVIHLPQDEPYILEVNRDSRYVPWGGHSAREAATFPPGTTDARIELEIAAQLELRVVDAATEEPVVRFSVDVTGDKASGGARLGDHEGGVVWVAASQFSHSLVVKAPGYVPLTAPVEFDQGVIGRQTVRLVRGIAVTGRVTLDGAGVAAAQVTFGPQMLPKEEGGVVDPDDWMGETWRYDVEGEAAKPRDLGADADGAFRIEGVSAGTYTITAKGAGGSPTTIENIEIGDDDVALGDVELTAESMLEGQVRLAGGASPVGLELHLDFPDFRRMAVEATDGTFTVRGLAAGDHSLTVKADGHRVLNNVRRKFSIAAGETKSLLIDLSAEGVVELTVLVRSGGAPLEGVEVTFDRVLDHEGRTYLSKGQPVGSTGDDGRVTGPVTVGQRLRVTARDGELALGRSGEITPIAGGNDEVVIDVSIGALELRFPDGFELPENGTLNVQLRPRGAEDFERGTIARFATETSRLAGAGGIWKETTHDVGRLAAGHYNIHVSASSLVENAYVPVIQTYSGTIEIVEGETLTIELTR